MADVPKPQFSRFRTGVLRVEFPAGSTPGLDGPEQWFGRLHPSPDRHPQSSPSMLSVTSPPRDDYTAGDLGFVDTAGPPDFKHNRFGSAPAVCGPWEGRVACQGVLTGFVITLSSQEHVPQMPRDVDIIHTYVDCRWGVHEYSRHPQWYIEEMTHIACIPRSPSPPEIPEILFMSLQTDKHWKEDASVAVHGLGLIDASVRKELAEAAEISIQRTKALNITKDAVRRYADFLIMLLCQVVDRMNYLPAVATRAMAVAAHVQRLCLEMAGLKTYLDVVVVRMESSKDFSSSVLDVVGGFLRKGAVTQTWHRVGLPYWVLQPLTRSLAVWRIVQEDTLPYALASQVCDPPILHRAGAFIGVSNLTGNWISSMLVSISKHIAGSHLSALQLTSIPELPTKQMLGTKCPRVQEKHIVSRHLAMRAAEPEPQAGSSKGARRRARRKAASSAQPAEGTPHDAQICPPASESSAHPSRTVVLSPFVEIPKIWLEALRAIGPVPQTPNSALYFFPPPFLLDTVTSIDSLPPGCMHPNRARADAKVSRYLHNLARIREFCRTRLFDVSLENRPLTISEWRAALWGVYLPQSSIRAGGQSSDARRAKRRLEVRNDIGALLHKVAHMDSYDEHAIVEFQGLAVDLAAITTNPAIRASLLWESHEVNFRAELLALDSLLVPQKNWMEIHRWEREMAVSGVWGHPSSAASVAASTDLSSRVFCWYSPPEESWESCQCLEVVIQGSKGALLEEEYQVVQQQAVNFYV